MEIDSTFNPVQIKLPSGEVIEIDAVPYEGWGYEPGKWYQVVEYGDDANVAWRRWWAIPSV